MFFRMLFLLQANANVTSCTVNDLFEHRVGHKELLHLLHRPVNILNLKNTAPIQTLKKC